MFLDAFKLERLILQWQYANAFALWDNAGAIALALHKIWPDLEPSRAQPDTQLFSSRLVQIEVALRQTTITLQDVNSLDRHTDRLVSAFDTIRSNLLLEELSRMSARAFYVKDFSSLQQASEELNQLNLARWPTQRVFDQPTDGDQNGLEIGYRFQDASSFAMLRLKPERVTYEAAVKHPYLDVQEQTVVKNRLLIDFDRGLLGSVKTANFRMEDWLKGFVHVLRRDIEKVIKPTS